MDVPEPIDYRGYHLTFTNQYRYSHGAELTVLARSSLGNSLLHLATITRDPIELTKHWIDFCIIVDQRSIEEGRDLNDIEISEMAHHHFSRDDL